MYLLVLLLINCSLPRCNELFYYCNFIHFKLLCNKTKRWVYVFNYIVFTVSSISFSRSYLKLNTSNKNLKKKPIQYYKKINSVNTVDYVSDFNSII